MKLDLRRAEHKDYESLQLLVEAYHQFEGVKLPDEKRNEAIRCLLQKDNHFGGIWLIKQDDLTLGYIAITLGFSLEMGGKDAFVDEFFLLESYRGHGFGKQVLLLAKEIVTGLGAQALHLEIDKRNSKLKQLYNDAGFTAREKYHLMTLKLSD